MLSDRVQQALSQVHELRARILENQIFRGYSGKARAAGGVCALLGAAVMSRPSFPAAWEAHFAGWALVFAAAAGVNYAALLKWYLDRPRSEREPALLRPTFDTFPPLVAGGLLTLALARQGSFELLFGTWMVLFGLVNLSARRVLPRSICLLGWFYIACGASCLVGADRISFYNPWPMGLVFFIGEMAGARIFARQQRAVEA